MNVRRLGVFVSAVLVVVLGGSAQALASLPVSSTPSLSLVRTIGTNPFQGSTTATKDGEGGAYVPSDDSLWIADDNAHAVYEVNASTGALKRMISRTAFEAAPRFGGGPQAGVNRPADIESMAYDQANDTIYVFSGKCCTSSVLPTAFRLLRDGSGLFQVESYQPLASGSDYTASAWRSTDGKVYVGVGRALRTYDYATNTAGTVFNVPTLRGILGMSFSADGNDLFVVTNAEQLRRVDWATKTLVAGWTFGLTTFGIGDSRAVDLVGDRFYVLDGYDGRAKSDPLRHAVYVFDVLP